jgi:general secretion pathway protein A
VYETYYRLTGIPFQLTPDSRFFFGSSGHSRAISHLIYGLSQAEGFIIITGEVGAGKTTLVEQLWSQLDRQTYVISRVVTTQVSGDDLMRLALGGFGIDAEDADKSTLLQRFETMVHASQKAGKRCLLVVDEVQNLSFAALEELRMLSNITIGGHASLQTILLGQPQFRPMLASPDLEQLRQRVLASYHLGPLSEAETRAYIEHRMKTVGWTGQNPFWDDGAFTAIFRSTLGVPRKINTLCSRVLLYGALEQSSTITAPMVEDTARELQQDLGGPGSLAEVPPRPNGPETGVAFERHNSPDIGLTRRLELVEQGLARQERAFRRLMEMMGTMVDQPR